MKRGKKTANGKSPYKAKLDSNRQMYGGRGDNSCCAHRLKSSYLREEAKQR